MIDEKGLAALRRDYARHELSETSINRSPFDQFSLWFDEALAGRAGEPNAMTLSTVDSTGKPSARIVLLKGFNEKGFVFYTNYTSRKAVDLIAEPRCVIHFFWQELERQVIVNGRAEKTSAEDSVNYFKSRPRESQLAAWASWQSTILDSRKTLEDRFAEVKERFADGEVPCPPFWGGFRIIPDAFEFWQGRPNRLHDRICYSLDSSSWNIIRLSP